MALATDNKTAGSIIGATVPDCVNVPEYQKHERIDMALEQLEQAVLALSCFKEKISGNHTPQGEGGKVAAELSLLLSLNTTPERIDKITNEIHATIKEIDGMLF